MNTKPPPSPIEGVVFGRSRAKTCGFIVLSVLLLLFGLFLVWAKLTHQVVYLGTEIPQRVNWWGLVLGICAVFVAPRMIFVLVRSLWVKRRLIIGTDRLQMIEHLNGQDVVVLQIPYANIFEFKYDATNTERRLGIDLHQLNDPVTYARSEDFAMNQQLKGRHFCVSGGYRGGPRTITTTLERAYRQWLGRS